MNSGLNLGRKQIEWADSVYWCPVYSFVSTSIKWEDILVSVGSCLAGVSFNILTSLGFSCWCAKNKTKTEWDKKQSKTKQQQQQHVKQQSNKIKPNKMNSTEVQNPWGKLDDKCLCLSYVFASALACAKFAHVFHKLSYSLCGLCP